MVRVLVVEDDETVMDITCKYVESVDGFAVVGKAADGESAKSLVTEIVPDLIVLDMYMPKKNGMELLAELRTEGCAVEVLFITAMNDAAVMERARSLGVLDYLVKPFSFERFKASLVLCDNHNRAV